MYEIVKKVYLNDSVIEIVVKAPLIAKRIKPGQFVILRVKKGGERIPLTVNSFDKEQGTIGLIFQTVGSTTKEMASLNEGDFLRDCVGPLGKPTETDGYKKVAIVGGGVGCAIALPVCKKFKDKGATVHAVVGFRNKDLIILKDRFLENSHLYKLMTDDGSAGEKGLVTDALKELIEDGNEYDCVFVFGPLIMMKFVSELTKKYGIKTIVSMNPIMIDGTGMCGGCRLTVDNEIRFACVDGPDFDGHKVDFDECINRNKMYDKTSCAYHKATCSLLKAEIKENDK